MLRLRATREDFSVYRLGDFTQVDLAGEYCFIGKTDGELSPVYRACRVSGNTISREDGQETFRVQGVLGFLLIGVLTKISSTLVEGKIGVFVVPIYNMDYILIRGTDFDRAFEAPSAREYMIENS